MFDLANVVRPEVDIAMVSQDPSSSRFVPIAAAITITFLTGNATQKPIRGLSETFRQRGFIVEDV